MGAKVRRGHLDGAARRRVSVGRACRRRAALLQLEKRKDRKYEQNVEGFKYCHEKIFCDILAEPLEKLSLTGNKIPS